MSWRPTDDEIAKTLGPPPSPSFTCPECGSVSHNPDDVRNGYCGHCHDWTGEAEWAPNDDSRDEPDA